MSLCKMKNLTQYIQEKLIIKKNINKIKKNYNYKYFPKTREELKEIIEQRIEKEGNEVDLNDIDVSEITDMSGLFMNLDFNGDIYEWDVSNVNNMAYMFYKCKKFNQDLSSWDVSNVENMNSMFNGCHNFNQDISPWDVSKVTNMDSMFTGCKNFNQDISSWDVSKVIDMSDMFWECKNFNQDISSWDVSKVKYYDNIFYKCPIENKYKPKF